jgi:acetyl esterase/lipase
VSTTTNPRDRWSLAGRLVRRLVDPPGPLLERLVGGPPVVVEGRVLDRRVQALLARVQLDPDDELADIEAARRSLVRWAGVLLPRRSGVLAVDRVAEGRDGAVPVRVYRRLGTTGDRPGIVHLHGGSWAKGDLDSADRWCRIAADVTGCVVVSVHYRRPPEDVFPAAVRDALDAYAWVHDHAAELGVVEGQVAVMGESAGGNLAAVVAQQAGPAGLVPPIAQALVCPALDLRMVLPSIATFATGFGLERDAMERYRSVYVPDPADWTSPLASPLLAEDVAGLPPALVVTAGFDPLLDDGRTYADRLRAAGVPVRYRCYDSMVHGFVSMGILPEGVAVTEEVAAMVGALVAVPSGDG